MADKRTYIRVHDGMDEHPKIEPLSDKAFRLLMSTWFWCSRNRTDGRVSDASWAKRGTKKARDELAAAGLVDVHDGYVRMHDYLEHQRSAEQIADAIEKKRFGARLGNHRRWHTDGATDPECEYCPPLEPSDPDPPPPDNPPSHDRSDMRSDDRSQNDRFGSPEDRGQITEEDLLNLAPNGAESNRARAKRPTPAELAATAHSPAAHRLVENYAATCRKRPPSSLLSALAVQVDALIAENWTPDELGPVIAAWGSKGLHPKAFASVAHEITNSDRAIGAGQPPSQTGSRRVDKAMAYLAPDDPFLQQLGGNTHPLRVIEGGQSA